MIVYHVCSLKKLDKYRKNWKDTCASTCLGEYRSDATNVYFYWKKNHIKVEVPE